MKVYRQFLASYLCVCLVPLLLSMVTIGRLEQQVQQSIMENQKSSMQSVGQEIDQLLGDAASIVSTFSQDELASRLAEKDAMDAQDLFDLCELSQSLATVTGQSPAFFRGFCYFARSGFLVTDRRTYHPEAADLFAWDLELEAEHFYPVLDDSSAAEHITTIYKKTQGGWILVLRSQYEPRSREFLSCIGIVIQLDKSLAPWNTGDFEAFVTSDAYQLICGGSRAPAACGYLAQSGADEGELELDGQRYVYSQYRSGLSGIRYGFLARRETYYQELQIAWTHLIIEIVVIFGVSVLLAVFWSKRTYRPIKNLLPFVDTGQASPGYRSITELGSALVSFAQEKEDLETQVEQSEQQVRSAELGQYLLGLTGSPSLLSQYLEDGQPYQLLAFVPAEAPPSPEAALQNLRECLDRLLLESDGGVSLQFPWCAAVLVQRSLSYEEMAQVHFAAEQTLSLPLVCYMSDTCTHLEDAPQAWASVYRALHHDSFWMKGRKRGVWLASSLLENDSFESYRGFLSRQKTLTECLIAGKKQQAENCLKKIVEEDLSDKALLVEKVRRRYADIVEILLPYVAQDQAGGMGQRFQQYETARDMERGLWAVFGCISWEAKPESSEMKKELAGRVRSYIQANYQDPALNASMIADYLNMNLSTLSHQYKAATGNGVLDELHTVRIEIAKKLLADGLSVRETAECTGYVDPRALIRAFKRYEGITPGQYAKNGTLQQ